MKGLLTADRMAAPLWRLRASPGSPLACQSRAPASPYRKRNVLKVDEIPSSLVEHRKQVVPGFCGWRFQKSCLIGDCCIGQVCTREHCRGTLQLRPSLH